MKVSSLTFGACLATAAALIISVSSSTSRVSQSSENNHQEPIILNSNHKSSSSAPHPNDRTIPLRPERSVLGGLALVAPVIFPEVRRRRSFEGNWSGRSFEPLDFARFVGRNFQAPPNGGAPLTADERQAQGIQGLLTRGLVGVSESIMGWVERSVDDLPSFPRLDAQECMKRSVCEAHNQPKKYGALGLALQLFFPPYTETDESKVRVVSKYQLAARYGRQDNANCSSQYDGCMVNILDIVQALINLVF